MVEKELRVEIFGRVQGINMRWEIKRFCDKNELNGYVMNREDGSVMAVVQGAEEKLNELVSWLKKSPGFSSVKEVKTEFSGLPGKKKYDSFEIIREKDYLIDKGEALLNLGKYMIGKTRK